MMRSILTAKLLKAVWLALAFFQITTGAAHCAEETGNDMSQKSFNLRVGDQKPLTDPDMVFRFTAVVEDSRCPEGVTCIWEGNAAISVEVQRGSETPRTVTLNTHGSPKMPDRADAFGHVIKLDQLTPYPKQDKLIESPDYEATLTVKPIN